MSPVQPATATAQILLEAEVPATLAGKRLDQVAARLFPEYSRARLQSWIRQGCLRVNEQIKRPRDPLKTGDHLRIEVELKKNDQWQAQAMALDVVFEDEQLLVLNKPAGTVVHPAAGHQAGTLLNGLLHRCPQLEQVPRAGIVHRLDKDTTGLMVIGKTVTAHTALVRQLQARRVKREYEAVVQGALTGGGTVDVPLGRHPVNRKKRAVVDSGQDAVTHYRLLRRYRAHSHVWVTLETGRTHQIRVHLAHIHHPLVGDPQYGGRLQVPAACSQALRDCLRQFRRQALHAARLSLVHPVSAEPLVWEAPLPVDMLELLACLDRDNGGAGP